MPILLGILFTLAGVGHYVNSQGFQDIYPPRGTWGIWYLPGSSAFHVAWTGIVELIGGFGLIAGSILPKLQNDDNQDGENGLIKLIQPLSALMLFTLVVKVTPANIYMFTHGATMGPNMGPLGLEFHILRFVVQIVFLSLLFILAKDSLLFLWGDELD